MHTFEIIYGEGKSHKTFATSYLVAVSHFQDWYRNTFGTKELPSHLTIVKKEI